MIRSVPGLLFRLGVPLWIAATGHAQWDTYDPNRDHATEVIRDLQMMSPEQRVDTAVRLLEGRDDSGPRIATEILLQQESQYVVPKIVDAIMYNVEYQEQTRRRLAFIVLTAHQGWPYPATYELLTDGLLDWRVDQVCRLALDKAPPERRQDAAQRMAAKLDLWYIDQGPATVQLLEILGGYGAAGLPALEVIKKVFLTKGLRWADSRIAAGRAIAQVGGLGPALQAYRSMDTTQTRGALAGLKSLGERDPSPYATDTIGAQRARAVVLDAFKLPHAATIQDAFDALPAVYGDAMFETVGDSTVLNPEIKDALIAAAEAQPSPELRGVLVTALRRYEADAAGR